jgi:hypothetical protein
MLRHVPRREPRVLALDTNAVTLAYLVVDLFEVRSSGEEPFRTPRSLKLRIARLVRRERPTAIVFVRSGAGRSLAARYRERVAQVEPSRAPLPFSVVAQIYPEAPLFAPDLRLRRLARVAVTALARSTFPPRKYETSRHQPPSRSGKRA